MVKGHLDSKTATKLGDYGPKEYLRLYWSDYTFNYSNSDAICSYIFDS